MMKYEEPNIELIEIIESLQDVVTMSGLIDGEDGTDKEPYSVINDIKI